ncbi:MAG: NAD(P)-binding domain-containing protein [Thiotrichaceae bacterium]
MFKVAIIGSGPGGLSAAARAAETGVSHVLLEAEEHLSNTIFCYQKGKHVMAEPSVLPLRSPVSFDIGKREGILATWEREAKELNINVRYSAEVSGVEGEKGAFKITLKNGDIVDAEHVVMGIGMQGNLRKIGRPGEDLPFVQYQLADPDEYVDEAIIVIGAGDAAIENAIALSSHNKVTIVNRRAEFARAKQGNLDAIEQAIESGTIDCCYESSVDLVEEEIDGKTAGVLVLNQPDQKLRVPCDRVIARLGAIPPRRFLESCGIEFTSEDRSATPKIFDQYESSVSGLYIIGALAGAPLIKQAMNQGYETIEYIVGNDVEPADEDLLREKLKGLPYQSVSESLKVISQSIPLLSGLTTLELRDFLLDSTIHVPDEGVPLCTKGDFTTSFFSIVKGSAEVLITPTFTVTLEQGNFFGEMSLITSAARGATVVAGTDSIFIETSKRSMLKLINSVPAVKREIDKVFIARTIQTDIASGVDMSALQEVIDASVIKAYPIEETLFDVGDTDDSMHYIRSGQVSLSLLNKQNQDVTVAYRNAKEYVGEMGLFMESPRIVKASAVGAVETICIEGAALRKLFESFPNIKKPFEAAFYESATKIAKYEEAIEHGGSLSFMMEQGLGEATNALIIDEALCVRCDNCESACADTHDNVSRLKREQGVTYSTMHIPVVCRHCEQPHCMKECPPDAIHRSKEGDVYIDDTCIGCGNCERNCPYNAIQMAVKRPVKTSLLSWLLSGKGFAPGLDNSKEKMQGDVVKKAVKCDLCRDLKSGPACVRACPTGAAFRGDPKKLVSTSG